MGIFHKLKSLTAQKGLKLYGYTFIKIHILLFFSILSTITYIGIIIILYSRN